jgi:tRNA U34 5-methylaminomethyl-2-thiouridine-forming methyltransferase MnmC
MSDQKSIPGIKTTKDGSTTLFSETFSQHYHNPNGAVAESRHVFFDIPKVPDVLKSANEFRVFEMGFGTGLNLILMKDYLEKSGSDCRVVFRSVEAYPIDVETAGELYFGEELGGHNPSEILKEIFGNLKPGLNRFEITDNLTLELFYGSFSLMPLPIESVDIFFHDPFSPEVNSELWTVDVFKRLVSFAKPEAVLSTYCAATSARAAMAAGGWKVAKTRGALGKREMTIASPDENRLKGFKRVNEQRLIERFEAGDFTRQEP